MAKPFDILNLGYMINENHTLKYLGSVILGWKDIEIRKSEIVVNTQFL